MRFSTSIVSLCSDSTIWDEHDTRANIKYDDENEGKGEKQKYFKKNPLSVIPDILRRFFDVFRLCHRVDERLNVPRREGDLVVLRGDGDPGPPLEGGQPAVAGGGQLHVVDVQQGGEEQLKLHLGQTVAEAAALACAERHEVLRFLELALGGEEPFGPELLRLLPLLGVHVDGVEQRDHVGVLRNNVTVKLDSSGIGKIECYTLSHIFDFY